MLWVRKIHIVTGRFTATGHGFCHVTHDTAQNTCLKKYFVTHNFEAWIGKPHVWTNFQVLQFLARLG